MVRAIELARAVEGRTSPNPPVGAVLVRDDVVVGEGSTQPPGGPHAEIVALGAAGGLASGSTLYVTLEPCSHWGRTPPCADALIQAGVSSVHAALLDPSPRVSGQGLERLRAHGVEVIVGEESSEAADLIAAHARYSMFGTPLVTLFQSGPADALSRLISTTDILLSQVGPLEPGVGRAVRTIGRKPHRRVVKVGPTAAVISDLRDEPAGASPGRRTLPATVWDWPELMAELARQEATSVLIPGPDELTLPMLKHGLIDRVVASVPAHIPGGFGPPRPTTGTGSYVVAYREDEAH